MKHIYSLLFFLPGYLCAQDWMPVQVGEMHHFRLKDSSYITHSLWIDSTKTSGSDQVFYLNRVTQWPESTDLELMFYNQGQFLGKKMTLKPDGALILEAYNYPLDTSITIYPNAGQGATWLAVQPGNVSASITEIVEGSVLGQPDSLKTIQFSNGATWVISKKHGLVSAPDFHHASLIAELSGLENQGLGDRLFQFEDFFDFNIGDIFEFRASFSGQSGYTNTRLKIRILDKTITPTGIVYQVERRKKLVWGGMSSGSSVQTETTTIQYLKQDYLNVSLNNHALVRLQGSSFPENNFSFARLKEDGIQIGKSVSQLAPNELCSALVIPDDPNLIATFLDDALVCNLGQIWSVNEYVEQFQKGLGRVYFELAVTDRTVYEELRGAVVLGDTLGIISPDWLFTATEEPGAQSIPIQLAPNPAQNVLTVTLNAPVSEAYMQLFNPENKLVRTLSVPSGAQAVELNLEGLSYGIYFLVLHADGRIQREKVVKMD